jgi:hypothetical protein
MDWDFEREREKNVELRGLLSQSLKENGLKEGSSGDLAAAIADIFISTSPPEKPKVVMHLMTLNNLGQGGGRSTKPGNIKLNIGKLCRAIAEGTLTITGAAQIPMTIPLAVLLVWNSLWKTAQVEISEIEAVVLYVMWMHKDANRDVEASNLTERCNQHLEKYGRPNISDQDVGRALSTLEKISTIEKSPRKTDAWWLREWVSPSFR